MGTARSPFGVETSPRPRRTNDRPTPAERHRLTTLTCRRARLLRRRHPFKSDQHYLERLAVLRYVPATHTTLPRTYMPAFSVPPEIEHTLVWTRMPIIPLDLPDAVRPRIHQDGLWGFTGSASPPPSPSTLPACLPALADWGITLDKLVCSPKGTAEEDRLVKEAGSEIDTFIRRGWPEREWETAWFVNPPVSCDYLAKRTRCIYLCIPAIAKCPRPCAPPRLCQTPDS